ncbi:hypothetical protein PFISCL1PPCAC_16636 [Pristionchus fissidentatus]|uniref:Transmembrane protein n=1 Tax=Pristionchus fissidentatus TaxID=1538716 RepID=A0AAV5W0D7_9BILA|nr:hypothetical protein PFISCL1PPCAC_16636 [Pristionchus fissidentatus]
MSSVSAVVNPPKVAFDLDDRASSPTQSAATSLKTDGTIYRAVPLSTSRLFLIIAVLSIFSFVYLVYAQYHPILFYSMTSIVAIFIIFIYTYGVFAIIYMVRNDYDYESAPSMSTVHITETEEHSF